MEFLNNNCFFSVLNAETLSDAASLGCGDTEKLNTRFMFFDLITVC